MLFLPPDVKKLIEGLIVIVLTTVIVIAIMVLLWPALIHVLGQIASGF